MTHKIYGIEHENDDVPYCNKKKIFCTKDTSAIVFI